MYLEKMDAARLKETRGLSEKRVKAPLIGVAQRKTSNGSVSRKDDQKAQAKTGRGVKEAVPSNEYDKDAWSKRTDSARLGRQGQPARCPPTRSPPGSPRPLEPARRLLLVVLGPRSTAPG